MKLAEALILRADCQKRFAQLKSRLFTNAKIHEGDKPAEKPQELMREMEGVAGELVDLIKRINKTNSATVVANSKTLSDVLAERVELIDSNPMKAGALAEGEPEPREVHHRR